MRLFPRRKQLDRGSPVSAKRSQTGTAGLPPRWRLRLLALEDRCVPSTVQVTSPLDDGTAGTLRYALATAHNGDKIVLAGAALGGITLTHGELLLTAKAL